MRVTGGKFKNRIITSSNQKAVRPTSSKMREAIFSMIGQNLEGNSFLDAFGGSGIMGVEAYSRGAYPVVITEKNATSFRKITDAISDLKADIVVKCQDAKRAIQSAEWDIIFLDPPYSFDIQPYLDISFRQGRYLVIAEMEHQKKIDVSSGWQESKEKIYGTSKLVIFEKD